MSVITASIYNVSLISANVITLLQINLQLYIYLSTPYQIVTSLNFPTIVKKGSLVFRFF